MPWDLVVKNGSKMRLARCRSMPLPVSSTVTRRPDAQRLESAPQEPLTIRHRAHGVGRIGDQIHHHLAQLNRVGVNR
jgi:hypothetical protein